MLISTLDKDYIKDIIESLVIQGPPRFNELIDDERWQRLLEYHNFAFFILGFLDNDEIFSTISDGGLMAVDYLKNNNQISPPFAEFHLCFSYYKMCLRFLGNSENKGSLDFLIRSVADLSETKLLWGKKTDIAILIFDMMVNKYHKLTTEEQEKVVVQLTKQLQHGRLLENYNGQGPDKRLRSRIVERLRKLGVEYSVDTFLNDDKV
jgi:hypothetical protein